MILVVNSPLLAKKKGGSAFSKVTVHNLKLSLFLYNNKLFKNSKISMLEGQKQWPKNQRPI